ncbi:MAG: hypothetical protein HWE22_02315 [Flavobacteriales bacterium]|nr:hypothetical protein [Flavobacteriales bacterium]
MKKLCLLIVEDDEVAIASYRREIKAYNLDADIKISETPVNNKEKAISLLRDAEKDFDAAIVDLDLLGSGGKDSSGNDIIREIRKNLRFPVFVITGTPQNVAPDLREESILFKIKTRGEREDIGYLDQLMNIYKTGITNIVNRKGTIEQIISNIFWNHLSSSVDLWVNDDSRTPEEKEKSLLRYTLLHMQEYLDEKNYHPSEFYITKPIKKDVFTGDIVEFDEARWIILTPSCDIVKRQDGTRNTRKILLCKIKPLESEVKNYGILSKETSANNDNRKRLSRYIQNNAGGNFHFIPKHKTIYPGLIDFQDKLTIDESLVDKYLLEEKMKRLATVSMPFLKDIISRYSNYFARQGSPDFNSDEVYASIFS